MHTMKKYPRTPHIQGSRLQPGDEDLAQVPFEAIRGRPLIVEEKIDGANCGISFDEAGRLLLQSRGHYLSGGPRERHFHQLKTWAATHQEGLYLALEDRYVLYGEWMYARHTVFYDALPHYFMEFDILDRRTGEFLDTPSRRALLAGLPIAPVPVVHEGPLSRSGELPALIRHSLYKSPEWRASLDRVIAEHGLDRELSVRETDPSDLAEGLYIKHEEGGRVVGRYKFIRPSFLSALLASGSHWLERPILPNQLAPGVDLYGGAL